MTDLISREEAIALLRGLLCYGDDACDVGHDRAVEDAIEAIANMPSADTLATNQINALKDALAQAESRMAMREHDAQYPEDYG